MKLSFSTNGWNLSFSQLVSLCSENKITGLEIHDVNSKCFEKEKPFIKSNLAKTEKFLFENGITISCLDSVCNLADKDKEAENISEIKNLIYLAKELNCKYVRLHAYAGEGITLTAEECTEYICGFIAPIIDEAKKNGVVLLVESMGIYSDTEKLALLLGSFASDYFSALWDIHHTSIYAGEAPEISVKNLGKHIKHLHIKDSVAENGKISYCLLGEGDLPI